VAAGVTATGGPTLAPGVVDQLQRWHGWGGEHGPAAIGAELNGATRGELPSVVVNDRPPARCGRRGPAGLRESNEPPMLFVQAGRIVRLGRDEHDAPFVQEASEAIVHHHLTRAANETP
jgi:hypothetical protein